MKLSMKIKHAVSISIADHKWLERRMDTALYKKNSVK